MVKIDYVLNQVITHYTKFAYTVASWAQDSKSEILLWIQVNRHLEKIKPFTLVQFFLEYGYPCYPYVNLVISMSRIVQVIIIFMFFEEQYRIIDNIYCINIFTKMVCSLYELETSF